MEAQATEGMLMALVNRIERDGHYLTPKAVERLHAIISECLPDQRAEGNQKQLASFIRDRMDREP